MVSLKSLYVFNLKSLQVKVVESEDGNSILQVETEHEALEKVCPFLNSTNVLGAF